MWGRGGAFFLFFKLAVIPTEHLPPDGHQWTDNTVHQQQQHGAAQVQLLQGGVQRQARDAGVGGQLGRLIIRVYFFPPKKEIEVL